MKSSERELLGNRASMIAILGNIFLTVLNISVGIMTGSYALVSEGFHTISDIATSVIAFIGFRIGNKPADQGHPLGYGRAESIAGLIIVVFLSLVAFEIMEGAIKRLFFRATLEIPSSMAVIMAFVGIIVNIIMSSVIIKLGEKARSPAIIADGRHQRVDIYSSMAIFIGIMVSQYGFPQLDPIIALFIGLMIAKTAYEVARDNLNIIMGKVPSEDLVQEIADVANSVKNVRDPHDIRVNYFGSYAVVTLHIRLPAQLTLDEAHSITHLVQDKIIDKIDIVQAVIAHPDPIGLEYDHHQLLDKK